MLVAGSPLCSVVQLEVGAVGHLVSAASGGQYSPCQDRGYYGNLLAQLEEQGAQVYCYA